MAASCFRGCLILLLMLLLTKPWRGADCSYVKSRAAYYGSPDGLGTPSGACGYSSFGRDVNGGDVAAVSQRLYRNGGGCGACYQVRCTNIELCRGGGVKVVATDHGEGDRTDFILSPHAYSNMARSGKVKQLVAAGVVDIEYKRVSCKYPPGHNLTIKIDNNSNSPHYLALLLLYQGGQRDVVAVELSQGKTYNWTPMRRSYGAVWDIVTPPTGPLSLRFLLADDHGYGYGYRKEWITALNVIPPYWKSGAVYDSNMQLPY